MKNVVRTHPYTNIVNICGIQSSSELVKIEVQQKYFNKCYAFTYYMQFFDYRADKVYIINIHAQYEYEIALLAIHIGLSDYSVQYLSHTQSFNHKTYTKLIYTQLSASRLPMTFLCSILTPHTTIEPQLSASQ